MRIGLDLRMLGGGSGIDRYITELTHEVLKQDKKNEYVLFFRGADKSADYKQYGHKTVIADIPHYSFAEQFKWPGILKKEKLDLVHFPHFNVPIMYRKPFVVTIHDLTHTLIPGKKKSRFFHRLAYRMVFNAAIKNSKKIIAVSESTKKDILDRFHIAPQKIQVVYEGFNQAYKMVDKDEAFKEVSAQFGIKKSYILYVGVWRRYKNVNQLAKAFDKLIDKGLDLELVLVGEPDKFYPEIEQEVYSTEHKDKIKPLGRVSDEDLNLLYNAATLFVLPSLMEGFGLTALEAAVTGTPVSCSDIPTLREILGQAAEYFDPNNLDNMTDVLYGLLQKPERLEELANLGLRRANFFSWKKAAEETINLYLSK
jgi:glycosyltransferase involved in cell wall biosynthesis